MSTHVSNMVPTYDSVRTEYQSWCFATAAAKKQIKTKRSRALPSCTQALQHCRYSDGQAQRLTCNARYVTGTLRI